MNLTTLSFLRRFARLPVWIFALLCGYIPSLPAQQSTPDPGKEANLTSDLDTRQVQLALEDQPLPAIIAALSEQIGHGIVMDGKPLETRGTFKLHTTAKAALDQVAEHFDCTWMMGKHGAVLMSKRFHQPGDLPQMHLKEMQKMAADLLAIWPENASKVRHTNYPFSTVLISPGNALFRTMSSEQLKALNGGEVLALQDLSAEQQDLVRLGILNSLACTSHDVWEKLNGQLAGISYSYLQWHSWFHNQLDQHPTPLQYSLEYVWPNLQNRGYDRLVTASKVSEVQGEKGK